MKQLYLYQETLLARERLAAETKKLVNDSDLRRLQGAFSREKAVFLKKQQQVEDDQQQRLQKQVQVRSLEAKLAETETILYSGEISNPRELSTYQAKGEEIKDEITRRRREEAALQTTAERHEQERRASGTVLKKLQRDFKDKKQLLLTQQKENEKEISGLDEQLATLTETLDPQELAWFQGERGNYDGRPLAYIIRGDICNRCYKKIPQAFVMRVKNGLPNIRCDHCNCYLVGFDDP